MKIYQDNDIIIYYNSLGELYKVVIVSNGGTMTLEASSVATFEVMTSSIRLHQKNLGIADALSINSGDIPQQG